MKEFTQKFLDDLVAEACASPRRRQHRNVHMSYSDPCQRLFNAVCMDSYIRPHRHQIEPRGEMLLAIQGRFALFLFDDAGGVVRRERFAAGRMGDELEAIGVEVMPEEWHTVIALEPASVLFEVKAGPFSPSAAKEFALWAPEEGVAEGKEYLEFLRGLVVSA